MLRNEIRGGVRTIVRALMVAGVGGLFVYVVGTSSFLVIMPQSAQTGLSGFSDALASGLRQLGLARYAPWVIGLFALSMLGGFTAWFGVGARLLFAAGIDSFLPPLFARRNAKTGAPVAAILLQAVLMLAFVLLSQAGETAAKAYEFLVQMSVLGSTVPYLFMFWVHIKTAGMAAVPGLWTPPGGKRMTRGLGWLGLVSSAVAIACTLIPNPDDPDRWTGFYKIFGGTAATLAVGLALYWLAKRKGRAGPTSS